VPPDLDLPELDHRSAPAARRRVAVVGGGMAGLAAAWRLSEPGWRDRFEAITVYQRGFRLGGKGASSRGPNGRIEEHGLHVWLGHYDNAFRLMRDCYEELDRERTDPSCPIRTWRDAFVPAPQVGMEDLHDGRWRHWIGSFAGNDLEPGDPSGGLISSDLRAILERVGALLRDFAESFDGVDAGARLSADPTAGRHPAPPVVAVLTAGAMVEGFALASGPVAGQAAAEVVSALDDALDAVRAAVDVGVDDVEGARQAWHLVGVVAAVVRGTIADGLLDDPTGFRRLDDEEFLDWIRRHGASEATIRSTYVRGLYDLVFGHADGDPERQGFGAGLGAFMSIKTLLDYKGAFFWKMSAGMGDVVFAPLHQALRARGVAFEFFHRLDALHLADDGRTIDAMTMGRQVALADGVDAYEPLVRVKDLPCFPDRPLLDQLDGDEALLAQPFERIWCEWPDAEQRVLRRGVDFDQVVFAVPPPMAQHVATELVDQLPEWADMVEHVRTVATQAFQLWLREDEPALGWAQPGTTMTGYVDTFDTWASMPQLLPVEDWPEGECRSISYFCNTFDSHWPPAGRSWAVHAAAEAARVRANAVRFCGAELAHLLPGAVDGDGFRWGLLSGSQGADEAAFDTQFWTANIDPSDRYVQSLPGSDRYRLRPDESGVDNLVLAGDWTDCGLNAGCIEAAVLSGLQAANALLGRHRLHRILGMTLP
jgi:uncharacterized protein with NAD-binding domain and iron-sulfur cluster